MIEVCVLFCFVLMHCRGLSPGPLYARQALFCSAVVSIPEIFSISYVALAALELSV